MVKRWRNTVLLAAIESVAGTEQSISASTDGIVCENLQIQFGDSAEATNEYTGSLDGSDDVPIGGPVAVTFDTYEKGSGTPGAACERAKLIRACSWSQVDTPNAIPTAAATISGTSGGDIIAPTAFGGADDAYNGMPLLLSGVPSNSTYALIRDFVDATQALKISETFSPAVNTPGTAIQIPINTTFRPHSSAASLAALTQHIYLDDVKHVCIGMRGNFTETWVSGRMIKKSWRFTGLLASRSDVSNPTPTYPDIAVPKLVWRNDNYNGSFTLDGVRIGVAQFGFENGNALSADPNPNMSIGYDIGDITGRVMTCTLDPQLAAISTRDMLSKLRVGTKVSIAAWARRSAGNAYGLLVPEGQVLAVPYGNRDGRVTEQLRIKCTGINSGAYMTYW